MRMLWLVLLLVGCAAPQPQPQPSALSKPTLLNAAAVSATSARLEWSKVDGATQYVLGRKVAGGEFADFLTLDHSSEALPTQTHTDPTLSPATRYTYRIKAKNAQNQSEYTESVQVQTPDLALQKPSSLGATVGSSTSVGLQWPAVEGASAYELQRKIAGAAYVPLVRIDHVAGGSGQQFYTDSGLSAATRYTYRIRAVNASSQSDYTESAEVQTSATASARYSVNGYWLTANNPTVYLSTNGVNFDAATLRVNGTVLGYSPYYRAYTTASITGAEVGQPVNLSIEVPEGTITAQALLPAVPQLTQPSSGANVRAGTALEVRWNYSGPNPDRFYVMLLGNGPSHTVDNLPGTARTLTIPAEKVVVPSRGAVEVWVYAINDGSASFTGPVVAGSKMGLSSYALVAFNIVP